MRSWELKVKACFYCLPPVLNGHLKQNLSNKTKNYLSSQIYSQNQCEYFETSHKLLQIIVFL